MNVVAYLGTALPSFAAGRATGPPDQIGLAAATTGLIAAVGLLVLATLLVRPGP